MNDNGSLSLEKRKNSDLKYNEFAMRNVFDRITDAFVAFDNKWNYIYLNAKAAEIIGRRPEEIIGKNIWEEFPEKKVHFFFSSACIHIVNASQRKGLAFSFGFLHIPSGQ